MANVFAADMQWHFDRMWYLLTSTSVPQLICSSGRKTMNLVFLRRWTETYMRTLNIFIVNDSIIVFLSATY